MVRCFEFGDKMLLLPVRVLKHYYPSPPYLLLFDSILLQYKASPSSLVTAIRQYTVGYPAMARATYQYLLHRNLEPDTAEKAAIAVSNISMNRKCRNRVEELLGMNLPRKPIDVTKYLLSLDPGTVIDVFETTECEPRVLPFTLHEYLESPAARNIVPAEYIEDRAKSLTQAQTTHLIIKRMEALAHAVYKYLAGTGSVEAFTAQNNLISTTRAALAQYLQLENTVLDAVAQRLEANADITRQRGNMSRGLVGVAGIELRELQPGDEDAVLDISEYLATAIGGTVVDRLKKLLPRISWIRRDRRIPDVYLPGPTPAVSKKPFAIIGIDVSGSVGRDELKTFVKTLGRILLPVVDPDSLVVYWSTRIEKKVTLQAEAKNPRPPSGGGTDPRPFFTLTEDYIVKHRGQRVAVVLLSDGWWGPEEEFDAAQNIARKASVAVAGITSNENTARELMKRNWHVKYVPMKT